MSSSFINNLLLGAAISSGLMAGIYFAFSTFVMPSFEKIEAIHSITAMKSINKTILSSPFMPLFFGSSILSVFLMGFSVYKWGDTGTSLLLIGGMVYFIGMFLCTAMFNVPLNNSLINLDPSSLGSLQKWDHYINVWTNWNHVRTIASLISCSIYIHILTENTFSK